MYNNFTFVVLIHVYTIIMKIIACIITYVKKSLLHTGQGELTRDIQRDTRFIFDEKANFQENK